ncbi:MAG: sigma-70 family RNA polymerase sigma factor [Bacteroidetes bacterium]|nr:sigma-70 family RNA polymerase sigma factor [Bacteroidota bacterium]
MSGTEPGTEQEILGRLQAGDQEALVTLYHANFNMVRNYVAKNNGVVEDAEDLLQDALVVLWQNLRKPDFEVTSKISTYIMAICKNLWLKQLNKGSKMLGEEVILPQMHSENPDHGKTMDMKKIHQALDELGDTCKSILQMFYFDGFDMDTIAKAMQFNNSDTAKAKKYQCFKKLEDIVKKKYSMSDFLR